MEKTTQPPSSDDTTTYSSPPRPLHHREPPISQSQPLPSPPLSPLNLQPRLASPPAIQSPDASSISSGHSSATSHVSSLCEDHESPDRTPPQPAPAVPVTAARRLVQEEPKSVTRIDPGVQDRFVSAVDVDGDGGRTNNERRRRRPEMPILRKATVKRISMVCRVLVFVLSLVSFSVMAADKKQGWALDSFHRYKELRYSITVNVIGCIYSGLQAADVAYQLAAGERLTGGNHLRHYADFFLDQMLAYLLMSSSSSAATRVEDWESNWGKDKFPSMATASVGLAFTAFVAQAMTSLGSGYVLCTSRL